MPVQTGRKPKRSRGGEPSSEPLLKMMISIPEVKARLSTRYSTAQAACHTAFPSILQSPLVEASIPNQPEKRLCAVNSIGIGTDCSGNVRINPGYNWRCLKPESWVVPPEDDRVT